MHLRRPRIPVVAGPDKATRRVDMHILEETIARKRQILSHTRIRFQIVFLLLCTVFVGSLYMVLFVVGPEADGYYRLGAYLCAAVSLGFLVMFATTGVFESKVNDPSLYLAQCNVNLVPFGLHHEPRDDTLLALDGDVLEQARGDRDH